MSNSKAKVSANYSTVETICKHAERHGLSDSALSRLLDVLTSHNSLNQTSRNTIVNALFPSGAITTETVFTVANSLGRGKQKAPVSTQQLLIKWLVLVYDLIEKPAVLSGLYSVFFNLLDMINLRANLCHLLARITRRKHVKPFRIEMLQQLSQSVNREPALEKLVQIYENLAPEVASATTPVIFTHPDPEWGNKLQEIREGAGFARMTSGAYSAPFNFSRRSLSRHTLSPSGYLSTAVLDVDSLDDVVNKFENIESTHLISSDLKDPLLQSYLLLRPEDMNTQQIDDMLSTELNQHLEDLAQGKELNVAILESILPWTRYTKVCTTTPLIKAISNVVRSSPTPPWPSLQPTSPHGAVNTTNP